MKKKLLLSVLSVLTLCACEETAINSSSSSSASDQNSSESSSSIGDNSSSVDNSFSSTSSSSSLNSQEAQDNFVKALQADYSNFTSSSTYTDTSGSFTDVFRQTSDKAYWKSGSTLYQDHLILFDEQGKMIIMFYLNSDKWEKSNLNSIADFVVTFALEEIDYDDVKYVGDNTYNVVSTSIPSVVNALFRSSDNYSNLYIKVENEHIVEVGGTIEDVKHVQTFYDFGKTEIDLPTNLPKAEVSIEKKDKTVEVGNPKDKSELISYLFKVTVDGKEFELTDDMFDFGNLNFENPDEGTYTITLKFTTWDNVEHTETATLTVVIPVKEETFEDIFHKEYNNLTFAGSISGKFLNNVYSIPNAYFYIEDDGSLTKYTDKSPFIETKNAWSYVPRFDLLFKLDTTLFSKVEDSNKYSVKNNEKIIDVLNKSTLLATQQVNNLRDYSIELTTENGRVSKIVYTYYPIMRTAQPSATSGTLRTVTYNLSDFDTSEFSVPEEIINKRLS